MSPVDDLREAARLLRERAREATVGPWTPASDGLVWAGPPGDPVCGAAQQDDTEYIASMHPLVGVALAEAFAAIAEEMHDRGAIEAAGVLFEACGCGAPECSGARRDDWIAVARMARLYLGRPE